VYAGPNLDARGFREGFEVLNRLGAERLYRITGHSAPFIFPIARYLWMRANSNTEIATLLMINDWITWRLCGVATAEPSNATESMLFDLARREWSDEILQTFDIPRHILPPLQSSGQLAGRVSDTAAEVTGLQAGTPVFVGGADTQCSLLGAGALQPDSTAVTLGTTTPVQMVTATPLFDPNFNLWAGCHVIPDRWIIESNAGDTGDAYLWLMDLIGGGRPREEAFALAEELARNGTGSPVAMFVGPSIFNIGRIALGRPGGILFPFPSLHVRPDRAALVCSFFESVAFAIRANLEQIDAAIGKRAAEIILSGGMSRSATVTRMITDVLGHNVAVARQPESAALGCAMLIMAGLGATDFAAAARSMVQHDILAPDVDRHAALSGPYRKWCELHERLFGIEI
jgi:autoinducer 2 (AI-2) kinase